MQKIMEVPFSTHATSYIKTILTASIQFWAWILTNYKNIVLHLQTWQSSPLLKKCVKVILEDFFPFQMFIPFQLPAEELNWSGLKLKRPKVYGRKGHALPFSRSSRLTVKLLTMKTVAFTGTYYHEGN